MANPKKPKAPKTPKIKKVKEPAPPKTAPSSITGIWTRGQAGRGGGESIFPNY